MALLLAAAAASAMYRRQQLAAASKVMPQLGSNSTAETMLLADAASTQLDGAGGARLCVPAAEEQVRLLFRELRRNQCAKNAF